MPTVRPLLSEVEIADAVARMGARITADYRDRNLTVLGVLTGSILLVADLMRQIKLTHQLGLIQASSYRGTATRPEDLKINFDFLPEIAGRDILLVDDIFDTGRTLTEITRQLEPFQPRSIRSAVLLWKKSRTEVDAAPDYFCREIPDLFVVGYGLDFDGQYRHLPYVGVLQTGEPET